VQPNDPQDLNAMQFRPLMREAATQRTVLKGV